MLESEPVVDRSPLFARPFGDDHVVTSELEESTDAMADTAFLVVAAVGFGFCALVVRVLGAAA